MTEPQMTKFPDAMLDDRRQEQFMKSSDVAAIGLCFTRLLGNRSSYRGLKLHRNRFSFAVILYSLLSKILALIFQRFA